MAENSNIEWTDHTVHTIIPVTQGYLSWHRQNQGLRSSLPRSAASLLSNTECGLLAVKNIADDAVSGKRTIATAKTQPDTTDWRQSASCVAVKMQREEGFQNLASPNLDRGLRRSDHKTRNKRDTG